MVTVAPNKSPTDRLSRLSYIAATFLPWVFARRFNDGLLWVRASDHCARREFKVRLSWRAFEVQQLNFLHWNMECIEAANRYLAEQTLTPPASENHLYLANYVRACAREAFGRLAEGSALPSMFADPPGRVRTELVDKRLLRLFPFANN